MIKYQFKPRSFVYGLFIFVALVIITDFILPGRAFVGEVINVKAEHQQYYNAARNYHHSYRVFTGNHNFSVSKDFSQLVRENQKIKYRISLIFKEVNSYSLLTSESRSVYSLRILSGLILPLIVIVIIGIAYKYENRISTLAFVIQVLLIADLIFLII